MPGFSSILLILNQFKTICVSLTSTAETVGQKIELQSKGTI